MTSPNSPSPSRRMPAQIAAFLLILLPGLGQYLTQSGPAWLSCAWIALGASGMILALLLA